MLISPKTVLKLIWLWPPFFAAGIKVLKCNKDLSHVRAGLKMHFYNRNYFGTHFGGSLYAMCDPFFVFMLAHKLGKDHIIWDIAAKIEFKKATGKPVYVDFFISEEEVNSIKNQVLNTFKVEPSFFAVVKDFEGNEIAKVEKKLYVRRKDAKTRFSN